MENLWTQDIYFVRKAKNCMIYEIIDKDVRDITFAFTVKNVMEEIDEYLEK